MTVTGARGFLANGVACGIKDDGQPDLALVATEDGSLASAAAVFTSNLAAAAPVEVSRRHLAATGGRAKAVVLNSGNANAATGEGGRKDAAEMAALVAGELPGQPDGATALVCSTGLIGIPLPMEPIRRGVPALVAGLSAHGGPGAARAILTTDTRPKQVLIEEDGFVVGGMAKGAAMLAPQLATMLAVLTTDAHVFPHELRAALRSAAERSFNSLSVDGCTSTNDTVIALAGGSRGRVDHEAFAAALGRACADLAWQMADDAEGATKVVRVEVKGARSDEQARRAARGVADSQLVKCSLYGGDPYWGRVVSELGSAGVEFLPDRVCVSYGGTMVCKDGVALDHDRPSVLAHLSQRYVEIAADLGLGSGTGAVTTTDLSHAYVDENMGTS